MTTASLSACIPERQHVTELAAQQIELYRRQGFELVRHFDRE